MKYSVNANPPGVGKTFNEKKNIINNKLKAAIFSKEHALLNEYESLPYSKHVRGFKHTCELIENNEVKRLIGEDIPPSLICGHMGCDLKCEYHRQFKRIRLLLSPLNYFNSNKIDLDKYEFILIDENVDGSRELTYNKEELKKEVNKLQWLALWEAIDSMDIEWLIDNTIKINRMIMIKNEEILKSNTNIIRLNIDDLINFIMIDNAYEINKPSYPYPDIFDIFKKGRDIRLLSATFDLSVFNKLLERYRREFDPLLECEIIVEQEPQSSKSLIIRVGNSHHYKSTMRKSLDKYDLYLKQIRKLHGVHCQICVLTYKEFVKDGKFFGVPAFWFGANKGVNLYEHYDVLVVFGSFIYDINGYKELHELIYPGQLAPDPGEVDLNNAFGVMLPVNGKYNVLWQKFVETQTYDAIHRVRPLRYIRTIYCFGYVPHKLMLELEYRTMLEETL